MKYYVDSLLHLFFRKCNLFLVMLRESFDEVRAEALNADHRFKFMGLAF